MQMTLLVVNRSKWIFRIRYGVDQARSNDQRFVDYDNPIKAYISYIQLTPQQQKQF